jgi:hypothetical protein
MEVDGNFRFLDGDGDVALHVLLWRFSISAASKSMPLLIHSAWQRASQAFCRHSSIKIFAVLILLGFGEGHTRKRSFFLSADDVAKERALKPIERAGGGD